MLGSNLTENKLHLQYKDQRVNVVYGNKSCSSENIMKHMCG